MKYLHTKNLIPLVLLKTSSSEKQTVLLLLEISILSLDFFS